MLDDLMAPRMSEPDDGGIPDVEARVLWLATSLIHHANTVRPSTSNVKVGGHQASSASMVTIMTSLYLKHLRAEDRVSVKPHAAPVLHAINYLLGRLDRSYLTELRAYRGLQSYPSRTKDPFPVDFSTGSVGIGATATIWRAIAGRYLQGQFDVPPLGRQIALLGDAELDEGAVWEALMDPMVAGLSELLWVIDLNRQSLDRIVPNIAVDRITRTFDAVGWNVITVKYGRRLQQLFEQPGGEVLRRRIDSMPNEEYQSLLRLPSSELRDRVGGERDGTEIRRFLSDLDDGQVARALRDLGGHDPVALDAAYTAAMECPDRPSVVIAYTIKARGLPTEGHPSNHSSLLREQQYESLAHRLGMSLEDPWALPGPDSAEAEQWLDAARRLERPSPPSSPVPAVPHELGRSTTHPTSTQQALGRLLVDLARTAPEVARRVVTVSPDVASSTNLGGWINKVGVWNPADRPDWFSADGDLLVRWAESPRGQHIELGIAETNLVGLIGELGTTWSDSGVSLVPIGTIYDAFVTRSLEPWSFGIYAGGQSILIGTPSGVTLAPEGGAHQSIITPSIGLELPQCISWEPCFAQDLEWSLLQSIDQIGRPGGLSAYFRLSTRPIEQQLAELPIAPEEREARRRDVLAGGYLLRKAESSPRVVLAGMGVVLPEVLAAADVLAADGVFADVVCVTSADLLFRALRARQGLDDADETILDGLFPADRRAPIVTVLDGHPHTLAFLAGVNGVRLSALGVDDFGQVGEIDDLYRHFQIDATTIAGAAWDLLDERDDDADR